MKGALRILASLLSKTTRSRFIHFQASQHPHLSPLPRPSSSLSNFVFPNTQQISHFSTNLTSIIELITSTIWSNELEDPTSIIELITSTNWSNELEAELEKTHSPPTYETVVYVLKNLENNPQKAFHFFTWVYSKNGVKHSSMVYSLMLRILGTKNSLNEFWGLVKQMSQDGFDVDDKAYRVVLRNFKGSKMMSDAKTWTRFYNKMKEGSSINGTVKCVVDVVLESELNNDLKKKLGELNVSLCESIMLRVFWGLYGDPLKAFWFFRWLREDMGYTHNAITYNGILRVLCQEESINEFWNMVDEMKSVGHDIEIDTYIKILRAFERSGMVKESVKLYELMMDGPFKPSTQTCAVLLKVISQLDIPDIDLVFRVVKKFESTGNALYKDAYDWMYRSFTSVGKLDEANNILDTMRNAGFVPDRLTYNHGVFGLCKAGRLEEAIKLFEAMESKSCAPDIDTWTILIQGLCVAGEINQALKLFSNMLEKNFEVNSNILDVLVKGLCNKERVDDAYSLINDWVEKANIRPFLTTYKCLIEQLLGERKLDAAMNLLRLMKEQKFQPFTEPYNQYISKYGTVAEAKEFLKTLSINKYPSYLAFLHLLQTFFKEGREQEAQDLLETCPHHIRIHPDILNLFASPKLENTIS